MIHGIRVHISFRRTMQSGEPFFYVQPSGCMAIGPRRTVAGLGLPVCTRCEFWASQTGPLMLLAAFGIMLLVVVLSAGCWLHRQTAATRWVRLRV